jgi:hypothetical protein
MAQCHARAKASGQPCQRQAIAGATVCRVHGGAAPQVKEAARLRILALVDPALATMARAVNSKRKGEPSAVEISAARDILDRAGLAAKDAEGAGTSIRVVVMPAGHAPAPDQPALDIMSLVKK